MTEVEKGIGKSKIGLVVCGVLIVILAISSLWLFTEVNSLQSQVSTLETDNSSLQSQVSSLSTDKNNLESQVSSLETWLDSNKTLLQATINERNQLQTWLNGNITNYESQLTAKDNQIQSLNSEIATLNSQIDSLNTQIESLNSQIATLNSQINSLNAQITTLESEIDSLRAPQLHRVEVYYTDNHPIIGSPYVNIYGSIFNSGSQTAYSVVYTVRIYDAYDTLLKAEEIHLGNIAGKSHEAFDVDIEYSGDADYITTTLTYD